MGHFYTDNPPRPFYEVPYADKKREGETRPTTISDAKKAGAFPSPNTVMNIIDKPGLLYWKLQMMADAVYDTIIELGGDWNTYGWAKSYDKYKQLTEEAANKGTDIHNAIEKSLYGEPFDDEYIDTVKAVLDWLIKEKITPTGIEQVFVNKGIGIGGMIDVVDDNSMSIVDWKTIDTIGRYDGVYIEKDSNRIRRIDFHVKDKLPLIASYSMGIFDTLDNVNLWNVFISRDEPGVIMPRLYTKEEAEWGWKKFCYTYELWSHNNDYDPRRDGEE